jgi:hypothetical protein
MEFARSSFEDVPQLIMKVFNFNSLTDTGASTVYNLAPQQYANGESVFFNLNVGSIYGSYRQKKKYFFGGRMYIEVGKLTAFASSLSFGYLDLMFVVKIFSVMCLENILEEWKNDKVTGNS